MFFSIYCYLFYFKMASKERSLKRARFYDINIVQCKLIYIVLFNKVRKGIDIRQNYELIDNIS